MAGKCRQKQDTPAMPKQSGHRFDLRRFFKESSGGIFIYTALALPLLLGVAGLAVDVSIWHVHKRTVQTTADAGAIGATNEIFRSIDDTSREDKAKVVAETEAANNGFVAGSDTITVNIPPLSGDFAGATNAVEVIIRRPVPTYLASLVFDGGAFVSARAVGRVIGGDFCILSLNTTALDALKVSGGADVTLGCGVYVNSENVEAIDTPGGGCLNAAVIKTAGSYNKSGCYNPAPYESTQPTLNPLEGQFSPPPEASLACDAFLPNSGLKVDSDNSPYTLPPGNHCKNVTVQAGGELILADGNHVFSDAQIKSTGGSLHSEVAGDGVTLYFPDTTGASDGFDISGGDVNLTAAQSGPLAGVLIYVDENAPSGNFSHNITAQGTSSLTGLIYAPSQDVNFAGGTEAQAIAIIADEISLSGQAGFINIGSIPGLDTILRAQLVE
jgi:hypothetical protein